MSYWLAAVIGYFFLGLNGVFDKFLLDKTVKQPAAFGFYVGILAPVALVLAPFGFQMLTGKFIAIALIAGFCFTWATYFYYKAIKQTSISRIMPLVGGMVPLFTLGLAYFLLAERLSSTQMFAFILLVAGAILITYKPESVGWQRKMFLNAIIASVLFSLSFTLSKIIYEESNFVSGLIWTRFGVFFASLSFLLSKANRRHILAAPAQTNNKGKLLYYATHGLGAIGGICQNYAVSIGSVTIVNALQGTQYVFVLGLSSFLSIYFPKVLKENITASILVQKITAIVLISIGLYYLSI
ncbi:MAG: EamA family transporter [Candidatus Saccharibacteria bacterium]